MRKVAVSLADSVDLRVILSVLYIITEVIRNEMTSEQEEFQQIVENFKQELCKYFSKSIIFEKSTSF